MPVSASTFNVPLEALADRTAWLKTRAQGAAAAYHYPVPLVGARLVNFTFTQVGGPGANAYGYVQGSTPTSSDGIVVSISVPGIGTPTSTPKLTSVKVSVRPANGHGANLPTTQWGASLVRQGTSGGAAVILAGPTLDSAGTVAAYEALREITLTANASITTSDEYYVVVTGEGGSFAVAGLLVTRIGVTVDPS